jgi:hypothetical protein
MTITNPLELAVQLIAHGVPVVVCKPARGYKPGDATDLIPPKAWSSITAAECNLSSYRPGKDALALVGGHGVDLVDVDAKVGAHINQLPEFTRFGLTRTPSGGWHLWVPSTGIKKMTPLIVDGRPVGDYVGGNSAGAGRLLGYLPGSRRQKYPGANYTIEEPIDLDALFDSDPDPDLVAMLLASGGTRDGDPSSQAVTDHVVKEFLERHRHPYAAICDYGRATMTGILKAGDAAASGGRHGWAVQSATRLVELMRAGCANADDYDQLVAKLAHIKPEGGTDLEDVMRWAIPNAKGESGCRIHKASPDGLDGLDASLEGAPIDELLDRVLGFAMDHIAFPSNEAALAFTIWIAHTHLLEHFDSTPRLAIVAPEKQSGKTRTLEVAESLIPNPLRSSSTTTAVLFRLIESADRPTVLIDEADAIWAERGANEELRALLNAGHRRGSDAHRMVGEGAAMKAKRFSTFAAVALAGIGDLPDTLMDRSVVIRMKRRSPGEKVARWRFATSYPQGQQLQRALAAWAQSLDDVPMPDDLEDVADRVADVWEPLFAVADLAGGAWPDLIRDACRVLTSDQPSEPSLRQRLLADLRDIWPAGESFAATTVLLGNLANIEDAPWGTDGIYGDNGITSRKLAFHLRHYGIHPIHDATKTIRGYQRGDLEDAWTRYLTPSKEPSNPSNPSGQLQLGGAA